MINNFVRSYHHYLDLTVKIVKIASLGMITKMFYEKIFKSYYSVEVALTQKGLALGVITVAVLGGLLLASKMFWRENKIMQIVGELIYKLMISTIMVILFTSIFAVISCGMIQETLVCTIGTISVWKTYWADQELMAYCVKKTRGLENLKGLNLAAVVEESKNDRDKCEKILKEAIEKVQEENQKKYGTWIYWLLGVTWEEGTNKLKTTPWTWMVAAGVILGTIGLAYAGIGAVSARSEVLKHQTEMLHTNQENMRTITNVVGSISQDLGEQRQHAALMQERLQQITAHVNEQQRNFGLHSEGMEKIVSSMGNTLHVLAGVAKLTVKMYTTGEVSAIEIQAMGKALTKIYTTYAVYKKINPGTTTTSAVVSQDVQAGPIHNIPIAGSFNITQERIQRQVLFRFVPFNGEGYAIGRMMRQATDITQE